MTTTTRCSRCTTIEWEIVVLAVTERPTTTCWWWSIWWRWRWRQKPCGGWETERLENEKLVVWRSRHHSALSDLSKSFRYNRCWNSKTVKHQIICSICMHLFSQCNDFFSTSSIVFPFNQTELPSKISDKHIVISQKIGIIFLWNIGW